MSSNNKPKLTPSQRQKITAFIESASGTPIIARSVNEVKDYHPVVANWLSANGYSHQHHVKLEDYGVVDFLATDQDGCKVLVEAKCGKADIRKAILQVSVYRAQLPDAKAVVIAPSDTIVKRDVDTAQKHNVTIIVVDFPEVIEKPVDTSQKTILIYRCPDCRELYYDDGDKLIPVGIEILEETDARIIVSDLNSARVHHPPSQRLPGYNWGVKRPLIKPIHPWPPLPGEKSRYGAS